MMTLNLIRELKSDHKYELKLYSDGQQDLCIKTYNSTEETTIISRFRDFSDYELITIATTSLRTHGTEKINLYVPYMLGARSDRKFKEGGVNYMKHVIAPLLNRLEFKRVICLDPHSDVVEATVDNFHKETNVDFVRWAMFGSAEAIIMTKSMPDICIVSPDGGSLKKCYELMEHINISKIAIGIKYRDSKGNIKDSQVYGPIEGSTCVIIDDIVDGGRTFIELAKLLKEKGATSVYLVVTHGIFSYGYDSLRENIDRVYTTNSFQDLISDDFVKVYDIFS